MCVSKNWVNRVLRINEDKKMILFPFVCEGIMHPSPTWSICIHTEFCYIQKTVLVNIYMQCFEVEQRKKACKRCVNNYISSKIDKCVYCQTILYYKWSIPCQKHFEEDGQLSKSFKKEVKRRCRSCVHSIKQKNMCMFPVFDKGICIMRLS